MGTDLTTAEVTEAVGRCLKNDGQGLVDELYRARVPKEAYTVKKTMANYSQYKAEYMRIYKANLHDIWFAEKRATLLAAAAQASATNKDVLSTAFGKRGGGYCWTRAKPYKVYCTLSDGTRCKKCSSPSHGVPEDVVFSLNDTTTTSPPILRANKAKTTYCSGFTFWAAMTAAEKNGLTKAAVANRAQAKELQKTWFGVSDRYHPAQSVAALTNFSIGRELAEHEVKAGDLVQMNRAGSVGTISTKNKAGYKGSIYTGHSVIFLAWVCSEGDSCGGATAADKTKRIGFRYYGSQESSRGAGLSVGCWSGTEKKQCSCKCSKSCSMTRKDTAFGRLGKSLVTTPAAVLTTATTKPPASSGPQGGSGRNGGSGRGSSRGGAERGGAERGDQGDQGARRSEPPRNVRATLSVPSTRSQLGAGDSGETAPARKKPSLLRRAGDWFKQKWKALRGKW